MTTCTAFAGTKLKFVPYKVIEPTPLIEVSEEEVNDGLDAKSEYVISHEFVGHTESWINLFVTVMPWVVILPQSGCVGGTLHLIYVVVRLSISHSQLS